MSSRKTDVISGAGTKSFTVLAHFSTNMQPPSGADVAVRQAMHQVSLLASKVDLRNAFMEVYESPAPPVKASSLQKAAEGLKFN